MRRRAVCSAAERGGRTGALAPRSDGLESDVCQARACLWYGKKFSSWHVGSRSIFNSLVRMDGSFEKENCGVKKRKKRHFSVHRLLHLSVSGALRSGNKSQYLNNGLDFINDFSP